MHTNSNYEPKAPAMEREHPASYYRAREIKPCQGYRKARRTGASK